MAMGLWLLLYFCNAVNHAKTSQEAWLIFFEENNYVDEALDMWNHPAQINRSNVRFVWFYSQALAKPNKQKIVRVGTSFGFWVQEYVNTQTTVQSIVNFCKTGTEFNIVCFGIVDMSLPENGWWFQHFTGTHATYLPYTHPFTELETWDENRYCLGPLEFQGIGKQRQKLLHGMELTKLGKNIKIEIPTIAVDGKYVIFQNLYSQFYIGKGEAKFFTNNKTFTGGGSELGKQLIKQKLMQCKSPFEDLFQRASALIYQNNHTVPKKYIKQIHKKTKEKFDERMKDKMVASIIFNLAEIMNKTDIKDQVKEYEQTFGYKLKPESSKDKPKNNKLNKNSTQIKKESRKNEVNDKLNTENIENLSNISIKKEPSKNECYDKLNDFNAQHEKESNKKDKMDTLNNTKHKKKSRKRAKKHSTGILNETTNDGKIKQESLPYEFCETSLDPKSTGGAQENGTSLPDNLKINFNDNEENSDENTDNRNSIKESDENVNDLHPTITDPIDNFRVSELEIQLKDTKEMVRKTMKEIEILQQNTNNKLKEMEKNQRTLEKENTKFKNKHGELLKDIDECRETLKQAKKTVKTAEKSKCNQVPDDMQSKNLTKNKLKLEIDGMKTEKKVLKNEIEALEVAKKKLNEDRNFTRTKIPTHENNEGFESKRNQSEPKKFYLSNHYLEEWEACLSEKIRGLKTLENELWRKHLLLEAIASQEFMKKGSVQTQLVEQLKTAWKQGYMKAKEKSKNN